MKFSILIPAYKAEYLHEAILSVVCQSYDNWELIILNDSSPEPVDDVVRHFNDSRIRYFINTKNVGAERLVDNWNKLLEMAAGDYVMCIGDDDRLKPYCLANYASLITEYPDYPIYHTRTELIDESSRVVRILEERPLQESVFSMMYHRWNGRMQFIGDFLFHTDTLRKYGGFYFLPMAWGSDDITTYILAQEKGIINMSIPGFQYRVTNRTLTRSGSARYKLNAIIHDELWTKSFLKIPPSGNSIEDNYYYKQLLSPLFKDHYNKQRKAALFGDMTGRSWLCLFFWVKRRKEFQISVKQIMGAWFSAQKYKVHQTLRFCYV